MTGEMDATRLGTGLVRAMHVTGPVCFSRRKTSSFVSRFQTRASPGPLASSGLP